MQNTYNIMLKDWRPSEFQRFYYVVIVSKDIFTFYNLYTIPKSNPDLSVSKMV